MRERPTTLDRLSDEAVQAYFDTLHEAYQQVAATAPRRFARCFNLGGHRVSVQAVSERLLARMTAALAHLEVEPTEASLTILLWDSASTDAAPLPSPLAWYARRTNGVSLTQFEQTQFDSHGELAAFNTATIRTAFGVWPSALHLLDLRRNVALAWIEDERLLRAHEQAAPLRRILSWWLGERGCVFVHAGGVGTEAGGVLLTGAGGVGKSTSTLACVGSALRFAGDDYCLLTTGSTPQVYSLYSAAKLDSRADLARLSHLDAIRLEPQRPDDPLVVMFLHAQWPDQVITSFPLRAVLLPRVTDAAHARLTPVSPAVALRAIAPSTVEQFPRSARQAWAVLAEVVQRVPCFQLDVGPDVRSIPVVIERLLREG